MAFVPWKDRVTATPHRYKLTEVAPDTYDLEAVPGAVSEAGTPVNATNLDRLIQRDGDDIKDTVVAFTEASTRANIATGESTATLFGKIKKWFTDLKTHAFTTPSSVIGTGTTTVPSDRLLKETADGLTTYVDGQFPEGFIGNDILGDVGKYFKWGTLTFGTISTIDYHATILVKEGVEGVSHSRKGGIFNLFFRCVSGTVTPINANLTFIAKESGLSESDFIANISGNIVTFYVKKVTQYSRYHFKLLQGAIRTGKSSILEIIETNAVPETSAPSATITATSIVADNISTQTISGVKEYTASPLVPTTPSGPAAAVAKSYADSLRTVYDKVIRTQAEFETLIADATWLGATSVALVGQFTLSTANNSGVKIPATVKQINGFNGAKITITNFLYNSSTAKGGLWYDTAPTTPDYSIRDLEVSCTGTTYGYGFRYCNNLSNCTGTGTGTYGYGFSKCNNLSNCTGTGTGTGTYGSGFSNCKNLSNCTGTGTGTTNGYGFYEIDYAVNCKDDDSSTDMWGGLNNNIDLDTCCKSLVLASNTTLNT